MLHHIQFTGIMDERLCTKGTSRGSGSGAMKRRGEGERKKKNNNESSMYTHLINQ